MRSPALGAPIVLRAAGVLSAGILAVSAVQAQYKVVNPDGSVTYTDRAPVSTDKGAKVSPVDTRGGIEGNGVSLGQLPLELRQAVQRYPVVLYVAADCQPCEPARSLLRQRGIPYAEKIVSTSEDLAELERRIGARSVPTMTVGTQVIRGLTTDAWNSYLDAAGYPRESRLPANYQAPAPSPLTEPKAVQAPRAPERQPAPAPAPEPAAPPPSGFRF